MTAPRLKDNNDQSTVGTNPTWLDPKDRKPGTLDAKWGDDPEFAADGSEAVYGTAVRREAEDGREGLLDRIFDSLQTSRKAETAVIAQNFNHAAESQHHSSMLTRPRETDEETLSDSVKRVLGRR